MSEWEAQARAHAARCQIDAGDFTPDEVIADWLQWEYTDAQRASWVAVGVWRATSADWLEHRGVRPEQLEGVDQATLDALCRGVIAPGDRKALLAKLGS